jgi:hypothetical protein
MTKRKQKQCKKCPWKISTNPHDIPNGYCEAQHAALASTIAGGSVEEQLARNALEIHLMACHESPVGRERVCVGWLHQQLTMGNNVALRLRVLWGSISGAYTLDGEQHETLEETLP